MDWVSGNDDRDYMQHIDICYIFISEQSRAFSSRRVASATYITIPKMHQNFLKILSKNGSDSRIYMYLRKTCTKIL